MGMQETKHFQGSFVPLGEVFNNFKNWFALGWNVTILETDI